MTVQKRDEIINAMRYKYTYNIHQWPSNCFETYFVDFTRLLHVHTAQDFVYDWLTVMVNHPEWQDPYQYTTGSHYYNRLILFKEAGLMNSYRIFFNNYYL